MNQIDGQSKSDRPPGGLRQDLPQASRKADFVVLLFYLLSALIVRCVRPVRWSALPDLLARLQTRRASDKDRGFREAVPALLGREWDPRAALGLRAKNLSHVHCRGVFIAALRRRQGWNPSVALIGRKRLETELAGGCGAMLWWDGFAHSAIIGKLALAEAGYRPWHLSAKGHGILNSPLAERFLNPRVIDVEMRYLAGRIVFDPASTVTATRRIMQVLAGNGIVSITNNARIGKTILVPFDAGMTLLLARTPLNLATRRGVALLPVCVIEVERFVRYEVTIGPNLATGLAEAADPINAMATAYAKYLLPLVRAHPAQWDGWGLLRRS